MLLAEFYLYNNNVLYFKYTVITNTLITEIDSILFFIITRVYTLHTFFRFVKLSNDQLWYNFEPHKYITS